MNLPQSRKGCEPCDNKSPKRGSRLGLHVDEALSVMGMWGAPSVTNQLNSSDNSIWGRY